ncbi:MAG: OadG family protein [Lachnospiraceae bacterium]|nr:OadG family protein [Lachnospiraceae bacterium]MDY5742025.1 OadG family protein [Lachnospiraceae bacterium]
MKKNKRVSVLLFSLLLIMGLMTGCRWENPNSVRLTAEEEASLKPAIENTLKQVSATSPEQAKSLLQKVTDAKEKSYLQGLFASWDGSKEDLGSFVSVNQINVKTSQYEIEVVADTTFSRHPAKVVLKMNENRKPLSFTISAVLPKGELLTRAGLNTLLGLGVVGATLAFLTIVIAQMKHIGKWSQKRTAAVRQTAAAVSVNVETTAESQTVSSAAWAEEEEIAAVISAALAAYRAETGRDSEFVVRSVRRVSGKSWKTVI